MNGYGAPIDPNDTNAVKQNPKYYNYPTGIAIDSSMPNIGYNSTLNIDFDNKLPTWGASSIEHEKTISEHNSDKYPRGEDMNLSDYIYAEEIVKSSQTATSGGRKFDSNKLEYGLVPPIGFKAVVEILTLGAQKYDRDNWKHVPDGKRRYFDAAMRHLWEWKSGERLDEETSKNHLAHAICNLMFLLEKDLLTE